MAEKNADAKPALKLKYGMIGGGQGAFIGEVHRKSIALDNMAELVAGCFSRSPENTRATGKALGVAPNRCYDTFEEMAKGEGRKKDKIDFVVIVTPNNMHFAIAKAFLKRGINVVCDKPLTWKVKEAEQLAELAQKNGLLFAMTYTYTGYPAVKQIRELIRKGEIGDIRFVNAEYPQEWLATPAEKTNNKQAAWRANPEISGKSNCVGDIGSHVENIVSYMTGLRIKALSARLDKIVQGRLLDDNATIMIEYEPAIAEGAPAKGAALPAQAGAKGLYWTSQIAIGYDNALKVRIFGSKGTIEWSQEDPNYFKFVRLGQPAQIWSRGRDVFYPGAQAYSRVPSGHPEGYFEALGNIYRTFIGALMKIKAGKKPGKTELDFPGVDMGVDGVRFINKCVESSGRNAAWVKY